MLKRKEERRMLFRIAIRGWSKLLPAVIFLRLQFTLFNSLSVAAVLLSQLFTLLLPDIPTGPSSNLLVGYTPCQSGPASHLQTPVRR